MVWKEPWDVGCGTGEVEVLGNRQAARQPPSRTAGDSCSRGRGYLSYPHTSELPL